MILIHAHDCTSKETSHKYSVNNRNYSLGTIKSCLRNQFENSTYFLNVLVCNTAKSVKDLAPARSCKQSGNQSVLSTELAFSETRGSKCMRICLLVIPYDLLILLIPQYSEINLVYA